MVKGNRSFKLTGSNQNAGSWGFGNFLVKTLVKIKKKVLLRAQKLLLQSYVCITKY